VIKTKHFISREWSPVKKKMFELFFTLFGFLMYFYLVIYLAVFWGFFFVIQGPFGVDFIGLIRGSTQFQIRKMLSHDPLATAMPSSVTPRQLTRLS